MITRLSLARLSPPTRITRWAGFLVVVAAWALLAGCGTDFDTSAGGPTATAEVAAATVGPRATDPPATDPPATATPAAAEPMTSAPIGAECLVELAPVEEHDHATARQLAAAYANRAGRCPNVEGVQELLYIWEKNHEYWTAFPAQEMLFFDVNVDANGNGPRPELIGLPFDVARANLIADANFPLVQDSGPTVVDDMTMYEFSGGLSVLLVITRQDVVTSVYFFDQT